MVLSETFPFLLFDTPCVILISPDQIKLPYTIYNGILNIKLKLRKIAIITSKYLIIKHYFTLRNVNFVYVLT